MIGIFQIDLLQLGATLSAVENATVTVRKESDGTLATVYGDIEGAGLSNPFQTNGTNLEFYAADTERYRIDIEAGEYSKTLRHRSVSTRPQFAQIIGQTAIFDDTTEGLANTENGDYFFTTDEDPEIYLILYINDAGIAVELGVYPDLAALENAVNDAEEARDAILENPGFIAVAADLDGDNTIGAVAAEIANVALVGGSIANVNIVGADLDGDNNIGIIAANIEDIQDVAAALAASVASGITYDNTESGLTATNVQAAIDELVAYNDTHGDIVTSDADEFLPSDLPGYAFLQTIRVTSTSNFVKADYPDATHVDVEVQAGGGGGGGADSAATGSYTAGGGGGGGKYDSKFLAFADLDASVTMTIGAAGSAGNASGSNGGTGGTTSFGSHVSVSGGVGGTGTGSAASNAASGAGGNPGTGGTAGDNPIPGQKGGHGSATSSKASAFGGQGGSSVFGFGGAGQIIISTTSDETQTAGTGYGGGGGGAASRETAGSAASAGTAGVIYLHLYRKIGS